MIGCAGYFAARILATTSGSAGAELREFVRYEREQRDESSEILIKSPT